MGSTTGNRRGHGASLSMPCSGVAVIFLLWVTLPRGAGAQELPPEQDLFLMEAAMEAMVDHLRIQRPDRPVVADTFGYGMPGESGPDWRDRGGPEWMVAIAQRLDLPLGGSADPGEKILLSVLPPRDGPPEVDTVRIPARASVRARDLDTGELVDAIYVYHWDVALVREPEGWRVEEIVLTAIASGIRIEDRERWLKGLPPTWWETLETPAALIYHGTDTMLKRHSTRVLALILSAVTTACAAAVTQSPSVQEREILVAAIGYYQGVIIWTTNLADSVIAVDVRSATVPNRRGPELDPDRAVHAYPEVLRQVAADLGSPVGDPEAVECRPVADPRGAYCSPAGAAAVIGVGRLVQDGNHAQVEVRAWYPWEGPRQLTEVRGGQLNERGDLLTLERIDGEWRVVSLRGLFIS